VVPHLVARAGVVGLGPKGQNRATGARLWVRHWKRPWGAMGGGGMVVGMR
jgi:hypothetical protein